MQLDDVREQLRDLAARVPAGVNSVDDAFGSTRRAVKRQRVNRAVAALAVVALIGTLAVVINASKPGPKHRVDVVSPTPPAAAPAPFTAEQLRAHVGVGRPKGTLPVDAGGARLWVPQSWLYEPGGGCVSGRRTIGLVSAGQLPQSGCPGPSTVIPPRSVGIIPTTAPATGPLYRTVHGFRVYAANADRPGAKWRVYDVPQLGVEIAFRGAVMNDILDTLAPSSRKVAVAYAARPVPRRFRSVVVSGVRLSAPAGWPVNRAPVCGGFAQPPSVSRFVPSNDFRCKGPTQLLAYLFSDGVITYPSTGYFLVPSRPQRPVAVLHHGPTTVTVYAGEGNGGTELDLVVQRSGSKVEHALALGLGRDGRIAGAILGSIEAIS